jgi:hypothetical protein
LAPAGKRCVTNTPRLAPASLPLDNQLKSLHSTLLRFVFATGGTGIFQSFPEYSTLAEMFVARLRQIVLFLTVCSPAEKLPEADAYANVNSLQGRAISVLSPRQKKALYEPYNAVKQTVYQSTTMLQQMCAVASKHVEFTATHAVALTERIRYRPGRRDTFVAVCKYLHRD